MAVHTRSKRIEVLAEPGPHRPRPDQRRRHDYCEHARRSGDPSPGGSSRQPIMTAYGQQALVCAAMLQARPARPRDLRTVAPEAGRILLRNVYCWFERTERGVYRLKNSQGEAALQRWPQTVQLAARIEPSNRSGEQTDRPETCAELDCAIARLRVDSSHASRGRNGCSEFQSHRTRSNRYRLSRVVCGPTGAARRGEL